MREAASMHCKGWSAGRGRARRRHRTEQRGLVGVGARRKERREWEARQGAVSPPCRAARPRWRGREEEGEERRERVARPGTASPLYRAARSRWRGRAKERRERVARQGATSPPCRTARSRWRGREGRTTTTTTEVTTTTTGAGMLHERAHSARWGAKLDDNYGGGDDNYPKVVETGAEGREEGHGWDRQK
jgi:hypothetical protein